MKKDLKIKLTAIILALVMITGSFYTVPVYADDTQTAVSVETVVSDTETESVIEAAEEPQPVPAAEEQQTAAEEQPAPAEEPAQEIVVPPAEQENPSETVDSESLTEPEQPAETEAGTEEAVTEDPEEPVRTPEDPENTAESSEEKKDEKPAAETAEDKTEEKEEKAAEEEKKTAGSEEAKKEASSDKKTVKEIESSGRTYRITVTFDGKSSIPADAELEVKELSGKEYQKYVAKTENVLDVDSVDFARIFDISIIGKDGEKIEPSKDVKVSIELTGKNAAAEELQVVHFGDKPEVLEADTKGNTVTFKTDGFSVYSVTGNYRMTYRFYTLDADMKYTEYMIHTDAGTTTFTQTIKNGEKLVVPQLPSIPNGTESTFSGWYAGTGSISNPNLAAKAFDFEKLPEITQAMDGTEIHLFARFADYAYVIFHEQYNGSTDSFPIMASRRGEKVNGSTRITISDLSVTYDDDSAENTAPSMAFYGWSYTKISTAGSTKDDNGDPVSRIESDTVTISGTTHLYPIFMPIHWLSFSSGPAGSGATYIPSAYYYSGEGPSALRVPVRSGYSFAGWYTGTENEDGTVNYSTQITDENGALIAGASSEGITVKGGSLLLSEHTTVYAKWNEAQANYTVVIWKQKVTDAAGLANDKKSYDFEASYTLTAATGKEVAVADRYKQLSFEGFVYNRCDDKKVVSGDGSTVLNVYYDRRVYKLRFFFAREYTSGGRTYIQVNNNDEGFRLHRTGTVEQALSYVYSNDYQRISNTNTWKTVSASSVSDLVSASYLQKQGVSFDPAVNYITINNVKTWVFTGSTAPRNSTNVNMKYYYIELDANYASNISGVWPGAGYFNNQTITQLNYEMQGKDIIPLMWGSWASGDSISGVYDKADNSLLKNASDEYGNFILYWRFENYSKYIYRVYFDNDNGGWTEQSDLNFFATLGTGVSITEIATLSFDGVTLDHRTNSTSSTTYEGTTVNGTVSVYYNRNRHTIDFTDSYTADPSVDKTVSDIPYGNTLADRIPEDPKSVREGYRFTGWYADAACSIRVFFEDSDAYQRYQKSKVLYTEMPDYNIQVFAGWETIWYKVVIDPNYGTLNGSGSTWFWEPYNGDPIQEYTQVTRNYTESVSGTYYYHYDDRDARWPEEWSAEEDNDAKRDSYYTTDMGDATDLERTFKYAENAYRYAGWYEVDQKTGKESLYHFGEPITHDTYLVLHWKKIGTYFVTYEPVVEQDGKTLKGTLDKGDSNETLFLDLDSDDYADHADIVVTRTAHAPKGYNFIGWSVRGDKSGKVYYPGESFEFDSKYAVTVTVNGESRETVFLDAVYSRVSAAKIVYDANGGSIEEAALDYGGPAAENAQEPVKSCNVEKGTATISGLANNSGIILSNGSGFTMANAVLSGWNTKADASGKHYDLGADNFCVDTKEPVKLYAEWKVKVYYHLNKNTAEANFGGTWDKNIYKKEAADLYSQTVYVNTAAAVPAIDPVYTGEDNLIFHFWGTQRYAGSDQIDEYDFSAPVTGELHLYAYWDGPIEVPVHAADASAETIADRDSVWLKADYIEVGSNPVSLASASDAAAYTNVDLNSYVFAFAAVARRTAGLQNLTESNAVTGIWYSSKDKKVHVSYADAGKADAPLADEDELYFVYYAKKNLTVGYKLVDTEGSLTTKHADTATGALGSYSMKDSIANPLSLAGYSNNSSIYYGYAIGRAGASASSDLQILTATTNNQNSRPVLSVRNTWRGLEYTLDGSNWTGCGYDGLALYVVYFESQPSVVTISEKTIGTEADMEEEFEYEVVVTEIKKTVTMTQTQRRKSSIFGSGNWSNYGSAVKTENTSEPETISDTADEPVTLKNGESKSITLLSNVRQESNTSAETKNGSYYYRDIVTTTTETVQSVTVVQSSAEERNFITENKGTAGTSEQPYKWTYTAEDAGEDAEVVYTNTHTPLELEIHLALVNGSEIEVKDSLRGKKNSFEISSGETKRFLTEIAAADLYTDPNGIYGFAGIIYGTDDGKTVTVTGTDLASVSYSQMTPPDGNIYELLLNGDKEKVLGANSVYYLYYPLPTVKFVKETAGGALEEIKGVDGKITNGGTTITLNGTTVAQDQMLQIGSKELVIAQTVGTGYYNMPARLDDGEELRFLAYTKLGAGAAGTENIADLDVVNTARTLRLKMEENMVKWSLDGANWNGFSGVPVVYAVYKEIGYDLQITKTVEGDGADLTKEYTLTIASASITETSYDVTGIGTASVAAVPAKGGEPGKIVVKVKSGSDLTISGLSKGDYTITETGASGMTLSVKMEDTDLPVSVEGADQSTAFTITGNTKLDLTNTISMAAPTGFTTESRPYWIMAVIGIAAAAFFILLAAKRRKEEEEEQ